MIRLAPLALAASLVALAAPTSARAQPLPTWDRAVRDDVGLVRPTGRLIGTAIGYGPCPGTLALPDSVTLVGRAGGVADSVGAVARLDAEGSEQWSGVALPSDPAFRLGVRVVGARCRAGRVAQLVVQQGAVYAVIFAEHPSAVGADGFLRAAPRTGGAPLAWRTTAAGVTLSPP